MFYPLLHCKNCLARFCKQEMSGITKDTLFLRQENGRYIYFAPVGNQFNFGVLANNKTPKIIVMGITTSPTARNNFILDLNSLRKKGLSNSDALVAGCTWNIFNSDQGQLQTVLSKILNNTGIIKLVGCTQNIEINRKLFTNAHDSENYETTMNNIYFTQMIMCASCKGEDGSTAPKNVEELGDFQIKCIASQLDFINSFNEQVDLLLSFGRINEEIIRTLDTKKIIRNKCKYHVNINHPTTSGWNKIDFMHHGRESYIKIIEEEVNHKHYSRESDRERYKTSLINCYDQFTEIKNIVKCLLPGKD